MSEHPPYNPKPYSAHVGYPVEPHRATLIFVLGLLSIVMCGILGPVAWLMGRGDLAKIEAGRMDPTGHGLTQAGMICGMVGTAFLALGLLMAFAYLAFIIVVVIGGIAAGAGGAGM